MTELDKLIEQTKGKDRAYYRKVHRQWIESLLTNPENSQLYDFIFELEDKYFKDMRCQEDSIVSEYFRTQIIEDDGEEENYYPHDLVDCLSLYRGYFRFYVEDLEEGVMGEADFVERVIKLSPQCAKDKAIVLHEMIHAYEFLLSSIMPVGKEILLLCLYNNLVKSNEIPDLHDRILLHSHQATNEKVEMMGGSHGVLFFLKSLDLDLQCGYKLGTVCGYGRDNNLEGWLG